jgi:hypothetical protein
VDGQVFLSPMTGKKIRIGGRSEVGILVTSNQQIHQISVRASEDVWPLILYVEHIATNLGAPPMQSAITRYQFTKESQN